MAKYTNKLEFIGILQFSQTHLRLQINFSIEIKKTIAKKFHENLMCSYEWIFLLQLHLNLCAISLWVQSYYLQSSAIIQLIFAITLVPIPWRRLKSHVNLQFCHYSTSECFQASTHFVPLLQPCNYPDFFPSKACQTVFSMQGHFTFDIVDWSIAGKSAKITLCK